MVVGVWCGIVIGIDYVVELLMGFFMKFGDGGVDILLFVGLNKCCVCGVVCVFGGEELIVMKVLMVDFEELCLLCLDEYVYGVIYDEIDDFFEGKLVVDCVYEMVLCFYDGLCYKCVLLYMMFDWLVV